MPANPKYLSTTGQRIGKVSAAILGGYLVSTLMHMAIGTMLENKMPLVMTTIWTIWVLWIALMLLAFASKKVWKVWLLYLLIIAICVGIILLNQ